MASRWSEESWDWGTLLVIIVVVAMLVVALKLSSQSVNVLVLAILFFGPALSAWMALAIVQRVSGVTETSSLSVWVFCLAASGLLFRPENVLMRAQTAPDSWRVIGLLGLRYAESSMFLAASGLLIIGFTMLPVAWCIERSRAPLSWVVDTGKYLVFLGVLLLLARRGWEYLLLAR